VQNQNCLALFNAILICTHEIQHAPELGAVITTTGSW